MRNLVIALMALLVTAGAPAASNELPEQLISGLSAADWRQRQQSAQALGAMKSDDKAIIAALMTALRDDDARVRRSAADALGEIGPDASKAVVALVDLFDDKDAVVVAAAATAVGSMGSRAARALPDLNDLLSYSDERVRLAAVTAIGEIGSRASKSAALLATQLKDQSPDVRAGAAVSLGQLGAGASEQASALVLALNDADTAVRNAASQALIRIGKAAVPVLIRSLGRGEPIFLQAVVDTLGGLGPVAVPESIRCFHNEKAMILVRRYCALALARIGTADKKVVPALVASLDDKSSDVRISAIEALGQIGLRADAALPKVISLSSDQRESLQLRESAIATLAQIGPKDPAVNNALINAVADSNPRIHRAGVAALVSIQAAERLSDANTGEVATLIRNLSTGSETIAAARRLGELGPYASEAVPILTEVLANHDNPVDLRTTAANSLGLIGPRAEAAVPELIRTLGSDNRQLRDSALVAMDRIGPQTRSVPALLEAMRSGDLAGRAAAHEKIRSFAEARKATWQPMLEQSDAPVLRNWLARHEALYGVAIGDSELASGRGNDEAPNYFDVLGGRAAVRESMQLELIANPITGDLDKRQIPLASVPGVVVESHPFKEMLKESKQPVRRIALAELVPTDYFFAWFRDIEALRQALSGGAAQFLRFESALAVKSVDYELENRYMRMLGLSDAALNQVNALGAIRDLAIITPDLFFVDGTDISVVATLTSAQVTLSVLQLMGFVESTSSGFTTHTTADGVTVYWAIRDDRLIVSNDAKAIRRILRLHENKGVGSLGNSDEFLYMQQQISIEAQSQAYFYFSDEFIRNLISPATKIAQLRRMQARAEMEMVAAGAMLFLLDGNRHVPSMQQLISQQYLPGYFENRDYTINDRLIVSSTQFGTIANPHSLSANPVTGVSERERDAYGNYARDYENVWSEFFDPIAMRIDQVDDDIHELTTFILPLLDSRLYNQVRDVLASHDTGRPLRLPVLNPTPTMLLSINLSDELRLQVSEGLTGMLAEYTSIDPEIFDSFASGIHLAVQDSTPIVALGSGDIWGALDQQMLQLDGFDSFLPFLLSLATQPSSVLIELEEPQRVRDFLSAAVGRRSADYADGELHKVQDKEAWIYTLTIENIVQIHLGVEIKNGYLVISNMPWSTQLEVDHVAATKLNGAHLQVNLDEVVKQLPALHIKVFADYRAAAVDGMGYLFPLLATGLTDTVHDSIDRHFDIFGFRPVHPHSGHWLWRDSVLESSEFGTALRPVQPKYVPGDRDFGVFPSLAMIGLEMQLEGTGLRARIRWRH